MQSISEYSSLSNTPLPLRLPPSIFPPILSSSSDPFNPQPQLPATVPLRRTPFVTPSPPSPDLARQSDLDFCSSAWNASNPSYQTHLLSAYIYLPKISSIHR
ncbi:hypothetical protein KC19_12G130500 [Ceratodon purpureus]|uniref:Uncharacterized protein n=1 Tax=Ceratodon purpureus TaxID=3225 RepID=A0A8T0G6N7_CERPU|nr:hypothetical protein KC19_12G130500 [Ceratodon purpureus]